jgi:integrase
MNLASCLRASEIGGLTLGDVRAGVARPHLLVRAEHAKRNRPRRVPLWWDAGTLADLSAWLHYRYDQGAGRDDPVVCSLQTATFGEPLNRHVLRRRFHTACHVLGWDRLRTLTIHHGRHTFISHALAGGRTLAEAKAAAGHASLLTTSVCLHVVVDEREKVGLIAGGPPPQPQTGYLNHQTQAHDALARGDLGLYADRDINTEKSRNRS